MNKIIRYTCETCGQAYLCADDARKCEERHEHEYEVLKVNKEEYELPDFPEKIWIQRKSSNKRCKYRIDGSSPDLVWKLFYEISRDIHIGDCYLVKTRNDICVAIVTGSISNPAKLNFTDYNTKKNIDIYATTVFAKITIPTKDDMYKILYEDKLDNC